MIKVSIVKYDKTYILLSMLLLILMVPSSAFAIDVHNDGHKLVGTSDYYYAVQDTRYIDDGTNYDIGDEYFGWKGVKGYYYWKKDGILNSNSPAMSLACLSMKMVDGGWVQTGIMNWKEPTEYRQSYLENQRGNNSIDQRFYYNEPEANSVTSYVMSFGIDSKGDPQWQIYLDTSNNNYILKNVSNNKSQGKGGAQVEILRPAGANASEAPETYFGTNTSSWNGNTYQLKLLNGGGTWERWDQTPSAQGSRAHQYSKDGTTYTKYSIGYPYYYFAGYTP